MEVVKLNIYESKSYSGNLLFLLLSSIKHAIKENFKLYMTYDNSCETQNEYIPENILKNAIIDLLDPHIYEVKKDSIYWSNYYGKSSYEPILKYLECNLEKTIAGVFENNKNKHPAFPSDGNFIWSLCHEAWIQIYCS